LVKRTAENHGGSIKVNDAPGGGACFTLSLPIHPIMP
jgi:signal transduction histidine kinase